MKCKNCGNEFESGMFCPKCGTKVDTEDTHSLAEIQPQQIKQDQGTNKGKDNRKIVCGCVVAVVVTVIVGVILVVFTMHLIRVVSSEEKKQEKALENTTTEMTTESKADKEAWFEAGETYTKESGGIPCLEISINEVGSESVMEFGDLGDYKQAIYLDCTFKNIGEDDEYIGIDMFSFYADNQSVDTDVYNSMDYVSLSPGRETSGRIYAFLDPDDVSLLEVEVEGTPFLLKNSEKSVFDSDYVAEKKSVFREDWYKSISRYDQLGGNDWIDLTPSDGKETFDFSVNGETLGSVDPNEYKYDETYDKYLYVTSDGITFGYDPLQKRIIILDGDYAEEKFEEMNE